VGDDQTGAGPHTFVSIGVHRHSFKGAEEMCVLRGFRSSSILQTLSQTIRLAARFDFERKVTNRQKISVRFILATLRVAG
jgi:hypothetical protein